MSAATLLDQVRALTKKLGANAELDRFTEPTSRVINDALDATGSRDLLAGKKWLGHPLHPALTDLPIGFWTSAFLLDFLGGKKSKRAATLLVASGVITAIPTAMSGSHDFTELDRRAQRVGLVHAVSNTVALLLYFRSLTARLGGRRGRGVYLGVLGATAATIGGYLGGHLVFGADDEDETQPPPVDVRDEATVPTDNGREALPAR